MKRLIIGLLLSVSIVGFAQTGEKNFIDQNYIEVTGKAELEIVPDMIYLKIVLKDKDNKEKLTLPEIEKKMTNKLSEMGIDVNKDLSLTNFVSNLRTSVIKTNVILAKQYQLIVRDAKTLQNVFFEFQEMGISNVSIVKFDHSQIEQYRKDVKVYAVKAAKEKAKILANAIDQKIGKAIYVQEMDNLNKSTTFNAARSSNIVIRGYASGVSNEQSMETEIELEKIRIESTFLVRFALE